MTLPDWYTAGQGHVWLPYTQMQTMRPPLPVASASGVRLTGAAAAAGAVGLLLVARGLPVPAIPAEGFVAACRPRPVRRAPGAAEA